MEKSRDISRLLEIMAALRTPETGCPWDLEQTFATIAPYTIEEAFEVADAIAHGDREDLREELGDLLLQVDPIHKPLVREPIGSDPLEECLQEELRPCFLIGKPFKPDFTMFPEKLLK